jgi:hypothetical protein
MENGQICRGFIFVQRIILGLYEASRTKIPKFLPKLGLKSWKIGRLDNFLICKFSQKFANFRNVLILEKKIAKKVTFKKIFKNFGAAFGTALKKKLRKP